MHKADALLRWAKAQLDAAHITTSALDARLLFLDVTQMSHADLIANPQREVSSEVQTAFEAWVHRRAAGEPVSRILQTREFYGRAFKVSPAVLDPRPETELLLEQALKFYDARPEVPLRFLELGTGSGAIAVSLVLERPLARGQAVDISADALAVAKANAAHHKVDDRVSFVESDWYSRVDGPFDLIISNPPYISRADILTLPRDVKDYDPLLALDGGEDGLACYRLIAAGAKAHLQQGGCVMVEIGSDQLVAVSEIFTAHGFKQTHNYRDYSGHDRGVVFEVFARPHG